MASTSRAGICDLPTEVLLSIFSFLPVPDLAHCAGTCVRWDAVVTGFTDLWEGKDYRSCRSPKDCAETRAVLYALPPFEEVSINRVDSFMVHISYPHLELSVKSLTVIKGFPQLRCEILSTRVEFAGEILFSRSIVDLERLQDLDIEKEPKKRYKRIHKPTYVIGAALSLCPSLTHLGVYLHYVPVGYLDTLEQLRQLQSLKIRCAHLRKLSFLRHCSDALEELQLLSCNSLPSRELAEIQQLRHLRKLRLDCWRFEEGDLAAAVLALDSLELLQLHCCTAVRDLSFLRRCSQLQELSLTWYYEPEYGMPGRQQLPSRDVDCLAVTADDLPAALSRLQQLGLPGSCCAYLEVVRSCSQLRYLDCEFVSDGHRVYVRIALTGCT